MAQFRSLAAGMVFGAALSAGTAAWADSPAQNPAPDAPPSVSDPDLQHMDPHGGPVDIKINHAVTEQDLNAVNSGNTIQAGVVGSGAITLQDRALSEFSGIGNFVLNTGHNNNLQSTMSLTIVIGP